MRKSDISFAIAVIFISLGTAWSEPGSTLNSQKFNRAFIPGERLTYAISWSSVVDAGVAVMEVKDGATVDGKPIYSFTSTTRSVGIVESFYPVRDRVESIVDAEGMSSLSFNLQEQHGSRKRRRSMTFDQAKGTVVSRLNDDPPETQNVPPNVQDALSALYFIRTRGEFTQGRQIAVKVNDSGKTWAVEIHILGREKIRTPAGTFDTVKVKTYPKYEGVFMHRGEIYIWITDDEQKLPVLMKSTISIGSIVATLTKMEGVKRVP
jgi:hypothetical protein